MERTVTKIDDYNIEVTETPAPVAKVTRYNITALKLQKAAALAVIDAKRKEIQGIDDLSSSIQELGIKDPSDKSVQSIAIN